MADTQVVVKHRCLRCKASQKRKMNLRKNADALTTFLYELMPGYENYMVRIGCEFRHTSACGGQQPKS